MSKEVLQAIKAICEEKHISVDSVLSTIEQALAAAYRKDFGNKLQNLKVKFNPETMGIRVFDVKEVVEDQEIEENFEDAKEPGEKDVSIKDAQGGSVQTGEQGQEEAVERFNPKTQIMLSEAKAIKPDSQIGEEIVRELEVPGEFGRMAAQTAKQVIIQRLREAEREVVFNEYKDKEGQLINGIIQRVEAGNVLVDIGQATAIMPRGEQIRGEHYSSGAQLRFYIKSVLASNRGPEVVVSRADKELVKKLFEMEVPEIADGSVELKALSREPGSRSKIAVFSKEENIDPVGSCVGQRGSRVQFVINELGGEKIDIIEWNKDDSAFIKNALSPAKVMEVIFDEENKTAEAVVSPEQFSLAIGKQGQNVRLASALTGWRIDIKQSGLSEQKEGGDNEDAKEEDGVKEVAEDKTEEKVVAEENAASET